MDYTAMNDSENMFEDPSAVEWGPPPAAPRRNSDGDDDRASATGSDELEPPDDDVLQADTLEGRLLDYELRRGVLESLELCPFYGRYGDGCAVDLSTFALLASFALLICNGFACLTATRRAWEHEPPKDGADANVRRASAARASVDVARSVVFLFHQLEASANDEAEPTKHTPSHRRSR
jgi:hypothetical protein